MNKSTKERCYKCRSTDLRYSSSLLFKTQVRCGSCGESWSAGRGSKARKRYEREVYPGVGTNGR